MALKQFAPKPEHAACMNDIRAALRKHPNVSPVEMLAIVSQLVGNLIAMQDRSRVSVEMCIELVQRNVELGNEAAIESILLDKIGETQGNG